MKTLSNVQTAISGDTVTITAKIVDKDYSNHRIQQQTFVHQSGKNLQHHRHMHVFEGGVLIKTPGKKIGMCFEKQDLVDIATAILPALSYPPEVSITPTLTVTMSSELKPDLQWESSPDGSKWSPVEGQTTATLDKSKVPAGSFVRLKASSEAGTMITDSVKI